MPSRKKEGGGARRGDVWEEARRARQKGEDGTDLGRVELVLADDLDGDLEARHAVDRLVHVGEGAAAGLRGGRERRAGEDR